MHTQARLSDHTRCKPCKLPYCLHNNLLCTAHCRHGYDKHGYNRDGYDRLGYFKDGYHKEGYGKDGYDKYGYDRCGGVSRMLLHVVTTHGGVCHESGTVGVWCSYYHLMKALRCMHSPQAASGSMDPF